MADKLADVTGLILAGGAGRRMGGADKGLLPHCGRPLVAHAIERLAPQVGTLLISANRHPDIYRAFGYPVVPDPLPDYPGPLAGIAAGLTACTTPWLLVCPCDCPRLPLDLARQLRAAAEREDAAIAVASTAGRLQPTFQLCRRELLPALERHLLAGGRKVGAWCHEQGAVAVEFAADAFANLNSPGELA